MTTPFAPAVDTAINAAATAYGVDPVLLHSIAGIESGGNPSAHTGSYSGLFQLSPQEFAKYAGSNADINDPNSNAAAAAQKIGDESAAFQSKYGRAPTPAEIYLIHQQGAGGAAAHMADPDAPAWQNMASTAEGQQKGDAWAKAAIWGNVPDDQKAKYGSVDHMTSRQFMDMWADKVARFGGGSTQVADATGTPSSNPAPSASSAPLAAQTSSNASQSASPNPIAQLLSYVGAQNTDTAAASNSGQTAQASATPAVDPSVAVRNAVATASQQAAASAAAGSDIQMPGPRQIDLSKLRAALAARQQQGVA